MQNKSYKLKQLRRLLKSPEISDNFRKAIVAALEDGSDAAIESLGTINATSSIKRGGDQDSPQARE